MSATTSRPTIFGNISMLLAAGLVSQGEIAVVNSAGYVTKGSVTTGLVAIGLISETVDNSGGAAGDKSVTVYTSKNRDGGVRAWPLANHGADLCDQTSVGHDVFIASANAVAKTDGSGTRSRAGKCWGFDRDGNVLVEFDCDPDADAINALAASAVSLADAGALYDAADLEALALELKVKAVQRTVRGVVFSNVASLAAFTVTGNAYDDGLTYVAGDRVLLVNQSTPSQNGIYVVGTVVATAAPLTRAADMPAAAAYVPGSIVQVSEGTIYANSSWKVTATGSKVVGTDDPAYYPSKYQATITLASGTYTIGAGGGSEPLFLLSTTKSSVLATRNTAGGTITTTIMYVAPVASRIAGKGGTAAVEVRSAVAAGTILNTDNSTVDVLISNW